jgi:isopenicillin N synthase-like dioxygenase
MDAYTSITMAMTFQDDPIPTICLRDTDDAETVSLLRSACTDVGFFYLEGHGIDESLIADVLEQSRILFSLSDESKTALSDPVLSRGYTAMSEETLDPQKQKYGDTKEGFYIGRHVPADHPEFNPAKFKGPNRMPSPEITPDMPDCKQFCNVMETYHQEMCRLGFRIVQL